VSRVDSNYKRKPNDLYETPDWVVEAVIPWLPWRSMKERKNQDHIYKIWDPACGNGAITRVLADAGFNVHASDIIDGEDFFADNRTHDADGILTNPPYTDVAVFIQHAIDVMRSCNGWVVMLLAADFDSAKSRRHLFVDCPIFAKTVVLTKRITWFERSDGKKAAPSENHRWYIWDWKHSGPPTIGYAP
jgi:hypothetical protein